MLAMSIMLSGVLRNLILFGQTINRARISMTNQVKHEISITSNTNKNPCFSEIFSNSLSEFFSDAFSIPFSSVAYLFDK